MNLGDMNRKAMNVLAAEFLSSPSEEIVSLDLENIGQQVLGFEDKIFNHSVDRTIANFNSRNLEISESHEMDVQEHNGCSQKIQE